jgi:hypothetical protein
MQHSATRCPQCSAIDPIAIDCSVIAFFIAKETFRVRDAIGYFLALAGGVVMIHFAPSEDDTLTSAVVCHVDLAAICCDVLRCVAMCCDVLQ